MAIGALLPAGYETLEDANGATVPGGLIWTYAAGTTTPLATFTDSSLTVQNSFPIIADGSGRWVAYSPTGQSFKLVFETPAIPPAHGATIRTVDNVSGPVFTGQLQFPAVQVPSADPNTLDDYEEGSWTPAVGGSGGTSGQTYSSQTGTYVKVGRQVTVSYDVQMTAKGTISGNAQIQGLPFPCNSNSSGSLVYWNGLLTTKVFVGHLGQGTAGLMSTLGVAATGIALLQGTDISNALFITGSMTYITTQ